MLYLIGLGLNPKQLTLEALHAAQGCEKLFVESYTSAFAQGELGELETLLHHPIIPLFRSDVEEKNALLLESAKNKNIALLVFGNPLTATTHHALLQECAAKKIPFRVIPGISIFNYRGICGLDEYRFGRTTTFVFPQEGFEPLSVFDVILENRKIGLHTHCLFDLHPEKMRFMTISEAIEWMEHASHARNESIHDWMGVGLSGMGNTNGEAIAGTLSQLKKMQWKHYPQSLIVCGRLTEYERDALHTLGKWKG